MLPRAKVGEWILAVLEDADEHCRREIRDAIERTQGTRVLLTVISDNLRRLERLGLIEARWAAASGRQGRARCYRLTVPRGEAHADDA